MTAVAYSAGELLNIYNGVVARHGLTGKPMSRPALQQMAAFGAWCVERGVDPAEWIRDAHEHIRWRSAIPLDRLIASNPRRVFTHKAFGAKKQAHALNQERIADKIEHNGNLWGNALRSIGEVMKRALRIDPESCLFQMDLTGGWNPRSPLCAECPVAARCAQMLPADVIRRRRDVGRG